MPDILAYNVYFSPDGDRMTVVHVHAGSDSLAHLMDAAGHKFPPIGEFISLEAIDVYGQPSDVVETLDEKASSLGGGEVTIHERHGGLDRIAAD